MSILNQTQFDPLAIGGGILDSSYMKTLNDKNKIDKKVSSLSHKTTNAKNEYDKLTAQIKQAKTNGDDELVEKLRKQQTEAFNKWKQTDQAYRNAVKEKKNINNLLKNNPAEVETKENSGQQTTTGEKTATKKIIDSITGETVTGYYNKGTGQYEQISSPLIPGDEIPVTIDPEAEKILKSRNEGAQLSCDNADIGGFEEIGKVKGSHEVVVVNNADHTLFAGVKVENISYGDINMDTLTAERIKYYESSDKTRGFVVPWDGRFGDAFSNTQSIGNFMPYGDEWVGSPSISNPYALIRYEHIAGRKHHHYILDQRGTSGFRGTRWKPYANIKDYGSKNIKLQENGQAVANIDDKEKQNLGVLPGDGDILSDESGALYINQIDYSQEIWKPTKIVAYTVLDKRDVLEIDSTPSQIVVNTPERQKDADIKRLNALKHANIKNNSKVKEESANLLTPDKREFWLKRRGWIKCGNLYVEPKYCTGKSKIKDTTLSEEEYQKLKDASIELNAYIDAQVSRNWKKIGNKTSKHYLRKPNTRPIQREVIEPTFENLCNSDNWKGQEQFQYRWSDFLYTQYYDRIPNNYMVTLRRFPVPINDAGTVPEQDKTKQHLLPVATAVTWMGEATGNKVGDLMTFLARMNWRDVSAKVNEVQGNEQGWKDSPFGKGFGKWLGILSGKSDFSRVSGWDAQRAKFDPYANGMYANRIYGPVNAITKTKARERGLEFEFPITLNFHYELKSLGGINPKAGMLDVLANLLALTYNNADFWGGANRYFPNKPAYPFLGAKKGMKSWYSGNVTGFMDGMADQLVASMKNLGSFIQNLLTNPKEALKSLGGKGAQQWMAQKQRDKRPAILTFKALLTGDPVGEWHLVVGNPFNPMLQIGNLIVTGIKFSFGDMLGADDFPTEMHAMVTIEHGRPRDKGDIESMFNRGAGRLHYSYFGQDTEYWNQASSTKDSKIDQSWSGNKTTLEDNFSGETRTAIAYDPKSGKSTYSPVSDPFPTTAMTQKMYSSTTKLAYELSEKVGFKSSNK